MRRNDISTSKRKKNYWLYPQKKKSAVQMVVHIWFTFMHFASCCYTRSVNFDLFSIVLHEFVINLQKIIKKTLHSDSLLNHYVNKWYNISIQILIKTIWMYVFVYFFFFILHSTSLIQIFKPKSPLLWKFHRIPFIYIKLKSLTFYNKS